MTIVAIVALVLLALEAVRVGVPNARTTGATWHRMRARGLRAPVMRAVGIAQLVGAALLLAGTLLAPLGIAGALVVLGIAGWQVSKHLGYGDYGNPDTRGPALEPFAHILFALVVIGILLLI